MCEDIGNTIGSGVAHRVHRRRDGVKHPACDLWATRAQQWLVGFIGMGQIDVGDQLLTEEDLEAPVGG